MMKRETAERSNVRAQPPAVKNMEAIRSDFHSVYGEYRACTETIGSMGKQAYAAARDGTCPPHLLNIWETHVLEPEIERVVALSSEALLAKARSIDDVLKKLEILTEYYLNDGQSDARRALDSIRLDLESLFRAC
jgi:hypothetical protein